MNSVNPTKDLIFKISFQNCNEKRRYDMIQNKECFRENFSLCHFSAEKTTNCFVTVKLKKTSCMISLGQHYLLFLLVELHNTVIITYLLTDVAAPAPPCPSHIPNNPNYNGKYTNFLIIILTGKII